MRELALLGVSIAGPSRTIVDVASTSACRLDLGYPLSTPGETTSSFISRRSLPHSDLQLDGVEFSSLPSGLHLVEQDVVYFTKDGLHGVCVLTRRQTSEQGQRGFRLSSLGILLARSLRLRPWRHVPALKALVRGLHYDSAAQGDSSQDIWEPARRFFELRKARLEDLAGAGSWHRWDEELEFDMDDGGVEDVGDGYEQYTHASPTLHLLRVLGPHSRYTSTFSVAGGYSYTRSRPSERRAFSAKWPWICVTKTRRPLRLRARRPVLPST
ncbi:hypothetical protein EDB84DRAFT_1536650 [Lactarius hengduanensis]|nr:hypothetical protein EDB84DRAFT_1536650 [Lactarius hengduanensis]